MSERSCDLAVIGGGVIGLAVAYYAAASGLSVSVLESRKLGGQGSSVAAGLIAPSPQIYADTPFSRLALKSLAQFPQLRDTLFEETGVDIQLDHCGSLQVATTIQEADEQRRLLPAKQQLGLDVNWISAREAHILEPKLAHNIVGAMFSPSEAQIATSRLLAAYRAGCEKHHVQFIRAAARGFMHDKEHVQGIIFQHARLTAGHVVIAGGAWSGELAQILGVDLPIRPQRGQVLNLRRCSGLLRHIVFWSDRYLAPKSAGGVIIGAANDYSDHDRFPTAGGVSVLLQQALVAVPDLSQCEFVSARSGLRPRTPDKLPIIGPLPGWEGISVAAGHNSNGLLLSAITGQMILAQLNATVPPVDPSYYLPARFYDDKLGGEGKESLTFPVKL